jgi:Zn-dependent alcohol dehydrogenase
MPDADRVGLALPDGSRALSPQGVFTWADTTIADERFVVKVAADTPMVEASILGCAAMTGAGAVLNTAGVAQGDSVAVIGAGGVGLSALAAARAVGASPIIAVDVSDEKLELARRFGATDVVNATRGDPVEAVRSLTRRPDEATYGGETVSGVDFAFDCIGTEATMRQAFALARSSLFGGGSGGGTAVVVGAGASSFEVDARDLLVNQKRLIGSLGGSGVPDRDFPRLLDWWRSGHFDLGALVTDRFKLSEVNVAVDALARGAVRGRAVLVC